MSKPLPFLDRQKNNLAVIEFIKVIILIQLQTLVAPELAGVPVEILFWKVLHVEYFTLDVTGQQKD